MAAATQAFAGWASEGAPHAGPRLSKETVMGRNPVVAATAVVVLVFAMIFIVRHFMDSGLPQPGQANWYDMSTGKFYGGFKVGEALPPVTLPSGSEGVIAAVFARGSCDNAADRFVGFLYKYTDEGKAMIIKGRAAVPMDLGALQDAAMNERFIKRLDDDRWVVAGSDEGMEIIAPTKEEGVRICREFAGE